MNFPKLPTDEFFKLEVIGGVLLIGFFLFFLNQTVQEFNTNLDQGDKVFNEYMSYSPNSELSKEEKDRLNGEVKNHYLMSQSHLERNFYLIMLHYGVSFSISIIGMVTLFSGLKEWRKLQKAKIEYFVEFYRAETRKLKDSKPA